MNRLGPLTPKAAAIVVIALVLFGGSALALLRNGENTSVSAGGVAQASPVTNNFGGVGGSTYATPAIGFSEVTMSTSSMVSSATSTNQPSTLVINSGPSDTQSGTTTPSQGDLNGSSSSGGRSIEFFSNITMTSKNPAVSLASISTLAYSDGGYVAYSSSTNGSAYVVIRVPADKYPGALNQVESLGTVTSATSNSNDVTVQYTDLNATLESLRTEEYSLLRLLNSTSSVNSTLAIENQLQQIDSQIDYTESQILETATLITYSTISASITLTAQPIKPEPLALKLTVTPKSGVSPLSVTFDAVVTGGTGSYFVNYNFGDGTSSQGQVLVHQFVGEGTYNVTVTATDSNGTVASSSAVVQVTSSPATYGQSGYLGSLLGIFVGEVEDIVEVAVVAVPLLLVAVAVLVPLQKRSRVKKDAAVKQS